MAVVEAISGVLDLGEVEGSSCFLCERSRRPMMTATISRLVATPPATQRPVLPDFGREGVPLPVGGFRVGCSVEGRAPGIARPHAGQIVADAAAADRQAGQVRVSPEVGRGLGSSIGGGIAIRRSFESSTREL